MWGCWMEVASQHALTPQRTPTGPVVRNSTSGERIRQVTLFTLLTALRLVLQTARYVNYGGYIHGTDHPRFVVHSLLQGT